MEHCFDRGMKSNINGSGHVTKMAAVVISDKRKTTKKKKKKKLYKSYSLETEDL